MPRRHRNVRKSSVFGHSPLGAENDGPDSVELELDEPLSSLVLLFLTSFKGLAWGLAPPAPCANFLCAY